MWPPRLPRESESPHISHGSPALQRPSPACVTVSVWLWREEPLHRHVLSETRTACALSAAGHAMLKSHGIERCSSQCPDQWHSEGALGVTPQWAPTEHPPGPQPTRCRRIISRRLMSESPAEPAHEELPFIKGTQIYRRCSAGSARAGAVGNRGPGPEQASPPPHHTSSRAPRQPTVPYYAVASAAAAVMAAAGRGGAAATTKRARASAKTGPSARPSVTRAVRKTLRPCRCRADGMRGCRSEGDGVRVPAG
jgi:hypothetical protein